jgi:RNA polymerase sigma-70 factor (ECF subfamily)
VPLAQDMTWWGTNFAGKTDEELMLLSREQPEAFSAISERYSKRIYNFLLGLMDDRGAAEDLMQDTFLKAFEARRSYEGRGALSSWLYTIARNLVRDRARSSRHGKVVPLDVRDSGGDVPALKDTAPGPEEVALSRRGVAWVKEALGRLPEAQKEVLILSRWHGMTYNQIAEIVGASPEAVKQKAYRAVMTLRNWYLAEVDDTEVSRDTV